MKIKRAILTWVLLLMVGLLSACGGGGGGGGGDGGTSTPAGPKVARLEITPAGAMLTKAGESRVFSAKAFDAEDREVQANITWTSSNPVNAAVDSSGKVTAASDLGSAQIVVQVGDLKSAPALITVAQPASGVILLTDAQVIAEPTLVEPNAEADMDSLYEVLITGIAPPEPGSLLLGRESKAVGGEVISSEPEGNAVRVRLKLTSLDRLVQAAKIDEVLDFTKLKMVLPPEITDIYDVQNIDGTYIFIPKPNTQSGIAKASPQALFPKQIGPFKCEYSTPDLPFSLSQPATFEIKIDPSLEIKYDRSLGGLQKLVVRASTSFKMSANLTLSSGGLVNGTCEATVFDKTLPVPGFAGLLLAAQVEAGLGFEIEGSLTIPLLGAELTSETKGDVEVGLDCTRGECNLVKKFEPINTNQIRFLSTNVANDRIEMFVFGYGFAKLKGGMTLIEKMRTDVVTVRGGAKFEGSLAPTLVQVAPNDSTLEPDYQSSYKLSLLADVVVGPNNEIKDDSKAIYKLLFKLGINKLNFFKFQTSKPLSISPKGTALLDKASFNSGDALTFHVDLDPEATQFLVMGYNIGSISILQHVPGTPPREIARTNATDGQISFDLHWVADSGSDSAFGQNFYAFVTTRIPSIFDLELAKVALPTFLANPSTDAGALYKLTTLPLSPLGINDMGQVLGIMVVNNESHQVIWDKGAITDLTAVVQGMRPTESSIGSYSGLAKALFNNAGHFVVSRREGIDPFFLVKGATLIPLPEGFLPNSLNNNDQIAGITPSADGLGVAPAIWQEGSLTKIPIANVVGGVAINDLGHLATVRYPDRTICDSYRIVIKGAELKPTFNGGCSELDFGFPKTLTNSGNLIFSFEAQGYLIRDGQFVTQTPASIESVNGINEAGDVIGSTTTEGFVWPNGDRSSRIILKSTSQNWSVSPLDINNNKQIVGFKSNYLEGPQFSSNPILLTPKSPDADLEISMIAPTTVAPSGNITYAVNLHNKGEIGASNVRVEFSLPEDFTIIDSVGWSGCTTILATVTCKLPTLPANERRAFLVNVKAPADSGFYVMQARVGADESDPDYSNNSNVGITEIQ